MNFMIFMKTTITISKDLKDKLDTIGLKSESYDVIVQRLYDNFQDTHKASVQSFVREQVRKYETELTPVKKAMLTEVVKGRTQSWDSVKKQL